MLLNSKALINNASSSEVAISITSVKCPSVLSLNPATFSPLQIEHLMTAYWCSGSYAKSVLSFLSNFDVFICLTPSSCHISVNAFRSGIQLTHRLDLVLKLLHDVRGAHDPDTRSETEDPTEEPVTQVNSAFYLNNSQWPFRLVPTYLTIPDSVIFLI